MVGEPMRSNAFQNDCFESRARKVQARRQLLRDLVRQF
jgi:hypothetical protein